MSNFTITIKSDEDGIHYHLDPTPVKTADVIAALEVAKLMVWENKKPKEEAEKEAPVPEMNIGEVRELNGKRYRCVLAGDRDCPQCPFDCADGKCGWPCGDCASDYRKDKNNVIFEEVKEDLVRQEFNQQISYKWQQ